MTRPAPQQRFQAEPLLAAIGESEITNTNAGYLGESTQPWVAGFAAHVLAVSAATVHRWKAEGIPQHAADKAAIHIGLHPAELWPDFYDDLEESA